MKTTQLTPAMDSARSRLAAAAVQGSDSRRDQSCPVCGGATRLAGTRSDDRYGYPGAFALLHCPACGHRRLDATMSEAQIADLYTRYYPRSELNIESWSPPGEYAGIGAWWRGERANALHWVPPNVRVLDVGCGFGESLGYHLNRGCDAHGVEADANILRVAKRYGLNGRHGLFDPRHYAPQSFDVVTLNQVIEHVVDPAQVLAGIRQVLKPGGLLVLSTPNADGWGARIFGDRWIHWHAPYHLQFFSRKSMACAAEAAGLELERHVTVTPSAWLDYQWAHLVTYPDPGVASAYWRPRNGGRSVAQRIALRLLRWVDRLGLNAALTRLMDATGHGDNGVYLLRKPAA
jgi:2-polyprenyl-3-methyl-5-hydroxy-6-metoxy-1,4-benzoquinol methylase